MTGLAAANSQGHDAAVIGRQFARMVSGIDQ